MRRLWIIGAVVVLVVSVSAGALHAADKLGKIFIKVASPDVNGQQFSDQALEDSAKDMRKNPGNFTLATEESEADFLLVVVERKSLGTSGVIQATLSVREGGVWKPGPRLTGEGRRSWGQTAGNVMKRASDWVKANRRK